LSDQRYNRLSNVYIVEPKEDFSMPGATTTTFQGAPSATTAAAPPVQPSPMMVVDIPPAALYQMTRALSSLFQFLNDSQFEHVVEMERIRRKICQQQSKLLDVAAALAKAKHNTNNNVDGTTTRTTATTTVTTQKQPAPQPTTTTAAVKAGKEKDSNAAGTKKITTTTTNDSSRKNKKRTKTSPQAPDQLATATLPPHPYLQPLPQMHSPLWPHPMLPLMPFGGAFPFVPQQPPYAATEGGDVVGATTNTPASWSRATFSARLQQIQDFKREYGHTRVPNAYSKNDNALGLFVNRIRKQYRTGTLHPDRVVALNAMDFDWSERRRGPVAGYKKKVKSSSSSSISKKIVGRGKKNSSHDNNTNNNKKETNAEPANK
jgi:Helicase associated domain